MVLHHMIVIIIIINITHTHTHTHTEYVLHMSKEDALAWLDKEPLSAAGCYASVDVFEMQQHWSNIAA